MTAQAFLLRLFPLLIIGGLVFSPLSLAAEEEEDTSLSLKQMLITPGDLTEAHADIEHKCEACHVHFEKANQTKQCLDCHELIADEVKAKEGFHGHIEEAKISDCKSCHTDHLGRDFDTTGMDQDNFDHSMTDFTLDGMHTNLSCVTCHTGLSSSKQALPKGIIALPVDDAYRFKEFDCSSCHEDFHKEALGDKCEDCHTTKGWLDNGFDHDKTDFPLDGEHSNLVCSACHANNEFEKIDTTCQSCHLAKEPHLGIFGKECKDCHTTSEWPNDRYDHFKETGYLLKDSHVRVKGRKVKCIDCHSEKLNPPTDCVACHKDDDVHQGSNGKECQECHNQKSWDKADFVHDLDATGFALDGAHDGVSCDSCHIPGETKNPLGLVRQCIDCHRADDPHLGKLGKDCGNCHQTEDWNKSVRFNHDFTDFPLTAAHQLLVCESCHLSSDFSDLSKKCNSCHKNDDFHEQTLGEDCATCHDTSVWSHWQFDHQTQTHFPLNGSHRALKCALCHKKDEANPLKPGRDCYSCHRDDDVHNGGFGVNCEQCHSEEKFEELTL